MSAPTIAANLRHAARNREAVRIGGGAFTYAELNEAARLIESGAALLAALRDLLPLVPFDGNHHDETTKGAQLRAAREAIAKASTQ